MKIARCALVICTALLGVCSSVQGQLGSSSNNPTTASPSTSQPKTSTPTGPGGCLLEYVACTNNVDACCPSNSKGDPLSCVGDQYYMQCIHQTGSPQTKAPTGTPTTQSSGGNGNDTQNNSSSSGMSTTTLIIAIAVPVGVVALLVVCFIIYKKRKDEDDEYDNKFLENDNLPTAATPAKSDMLENSMKANALSISVPKQEVVLPPSSMPSRSDSTNSSTSRSTMSRTRNTDGYTGPSVLSFPSSPDNVKGGVSPSVFPAYQTQRISHGPVAPLNLSEGSQGTRSSMNSKTDQSFASSQNDHSDYSFTSFNPDTPSAAASFSSISSDQINNRGRKESEEERISFEL